MSTRSLREVPEAGGARSGTSELLLADELVDVSNRIRTARAGELVAGGAAVAGQRKAGKSAWSAVQDGIVLVAGLSLVDDALYGASCAKREKNETYEAHESVLHGGRVHYKQHKTEEEEPKTERQLVLPTSRRRFSAVRTGAGPIGHLAAAGRTR